MAYPLPPALEALFPPAPAEALVEMIYDYGDDPNDAERLARWRRVDERAAKRRYIPRTVAAAERKRAKQLQWLDDRFYAIMDTNAPEKYELLVQLGLKEEGGWRLPDDLPQWRRRAHEYRRRQRVLRHYLHMHGWLKNKYLDEHNATPDQPAVAHQ